MSLDKLISKLNNDTLSKLSKEKLKEIRAKLSSINNDDIKEVIKKINIIIDDKNLISIVETDEITDRIAFDFDIDFKGLNTFIKKEKYNHHCEFNIGLIVGSSGCGKTTLLKDYGDLEEFKFDNSKAIASHFDSYEQAKKAFFGVGLNSIPVWLKPYNVLSNGEKYRALMPKKLKDGAVFDEFTSIVDRPTAKSMCLSIGEYIRKEDFKM